MIPWSCSPSQRKICYEMLSDMLVKEVKEVSSLVLRSWWMPVGTSRCWVISMLAGENMRLRLSRFLFLLQTVAELLNRHKLSLAYILFGNSMDQLVLVYLKICLAQTIPHTIRWFTPVTQSWFQSRRQKDQYFYLVTVKVHQLRWSVAFSAISTYLIYQ